MVVVVVALYSLDKEAFFSESGRLFWRPHTDTDI
jgi:hypothetical protein